VENFLCNDEESVLNCLGLELWEWLLMVSKPKDSVRRPLLQRDAMIDDFKIVDHIAMLKNHH
jgi:hypothetical protein